MNRDYQIGDWVLYIDKEDSDGWKEDYGVSLYGKLAKIIYINKAFSLPYLLEFKNWINGHDGERRGKDGHCWWCEKEEFKSAINHLKFKKWIKG